MYRPTKSMLRSACPLLVALGLNACGQDATAPTLKSLEPDVAMAIAVAPAPLPKSVQSPAPSATVALDDALERLTPALGRQALPLATALAALRDAMANPKSAAGGPLLASANEILARIEAAMDAQAQPELDAIRLALASIPGADQKTNR